MLSFSHIFDCFLQIYGDMRGMQIKEVFQRGQTVLDNQSLMMFFAWTSFYVADYFFLRRGISACFQLNTHTM